MRQHTSVAASALLCMLLSGGALAATLVDQQINSDLPDSSAFYLDGLNWQLSGPAINGGASPIPARVPGEVITDLQLNGLIADPFLDNTFLGTLWDATNFTYSIDFDLPTALDSGAEVLLVFDSVKMAALVELNGVPLDTVTNQFVRYQYSVRQLLRAAHNTLSLTFVPSADFRNLQARFMSCSGGWDWAPYGSTFAGGAHTFSKGIVRSVYLVPVNQIAIEHVVPQIFYSGSYPTKPLTDATAAPFGVSVRVHLAAPQLQPGQSLQVLVTVKGTWPNAQTGQAVVTVAATEASAEVSLGQASGVQLWWPLGMGAQPLYQVTATAQVVGAQGVAASSRALGFRVAYLVTADDADPAVLANPLADGSGNFTMRFKVNGADLLALGANMIPMEELEGRESALAYQLLVRSAADAHMNALRIWGGGVYLPQVFYDECDRLGVAVVLHDAMYGTPWNGGSESVPTGSDSEAREMRHSIRRLAHHPAILAWNGGNEWLGHVPPQQWETFVLPAIAAEDASRPVWPASPAGGLGSGVYTLTGLPSGKPFTILPDNGLIEKHGPYLHGGWYHTVDSKPPYNTVVHWQPPPLAPQSTPLGVAHPGWFASEFGISVYSSFESMSATLSPQYWTAHNDAMYQRNYAADSLIYTYFGVAPYNQTVPGARTLQAVTYLSMLSSALHLASDIANRRAQNQFGLLIWQLGEVWPTGGWGSLEYGPLKQPGQVVGGRWKIQHYMFAQHVFQQTLLICGQNAACLLRHDNPVASVAGRATLTVVHLASGASAVAATFDFSLPAGPAAAQWYCAATGTPAPSGGAACPSWSTVLAAVNLGCSPDGSDCLLTTRLADTAGASLDAHTLLLTSPALMRLPSSSVTATLGAARADGSTPVTLSAQGGAALYVTLTSTAQGRFSDNAVLVLPGRDVQLSFLPWLPGEVVTPANTRVEHVAIYTGQGTAIFKAA